MPEFIGAIDQGTTSTRFSVFDRQGGIVAWDQKEHRQIFPRPGWVEHDPLEIWRNTQQVMGRALAKAGLTGADLAALGVSNQRETTLLWDRTTGRPYHNAIVWQCTRSHQICKDLTAQGGQDRFRDITGLPIATYFSGPKLKWILEQVPEARQGAAKGQALFGTMDSWLIWWLTGGPAQGAHVSDVSNASRTMLMDLRTLDWHQGILAALDIPPDILPAIVPSADSRTWGATSPEGPLGARVPVCGALGDQQAALLGQACFEAGEAKCTYGTGAFLLLNTGAAPVPSSQGLLTTVAYKIDDQPAIYCLEGSIAVAGALVQWLRDNLGLIEQAAQIEELAASVADNGGLYLVPAFSGLFAPHWRPDARGVLVGLTAYANKGHLARAALEAIAYQTRDILQAMNRDSSVPLKRLKVDGGMVANQVLMQFQADILAVEVIRPRVVETTALGAAYAAGLARGFWASPAELTANWAADKTWQPVMSPQDREEAYAGWQKAVQRTLNWVD